MIGKEIGIYRITEKLGQGGMGVVFKAVDTTLDRVVALKALNSDVEEMPDLVERFRSEARVQAGLSHPNLTTLYSFFVWEGTPVMVMEFIEGETFQQMIARRGPIPSDVSVPLFRQALQGVGAAHRRGIIHRDIKPSNIMLNEQGLVKVMDFGIAKVLGGSATATRTNMQMGTSWYMSPEQIMTTAVDGRSDIYSLGVTLYEMLAGEVPFDGDSDYAVQMGHLEKPIIPPTVYYPHIPPHVVAAVTKALAKRPEDRFASVEEFYLALEGSAATFATPIPSPATHLQTVVSQAPPPPPPPAILHQAIPVPPPPPQLQKTKLPKWGIVAGAAAALAVIVGGIMYSNSVAHDREVERQRIVQQRQEAEKQRQAAIRQEREAQAKAEEERTAQELTERVKREQQESQAQAAARAATQAAAQAAAAARARAAAEERAKNTAVLPPGPSVQPGNTNAFQRLTGRWSGTYICAQGQTAAELLINATPQGVRAVMAFAVPKSQPGSFLMDGTFSPATNQLFLKFVRWGYHPPNYTPANISGTVNLQQGTITGRVIAPGCSTFAIQRK
jgi:hypothetical protein